MNYILHLLSILIIIALSILKSQGCHIVYFDKEIINKNVTYIAIEIKTKYCFADRRICNYVNRVPKVKTVEEFQLIPRKRCCTGYEDYGNGECQPKCNNCENGKCVYTDLCVCNSGYRRNYALNKCVSRCDVSCINGDCIGNNECECREGYKFLNDSQIECVPECLRGDQCSNGECIEPDVCNCNNGYEKNSATDICEPICKETCENGTCTGPNECTCNYGYSLKENSTNICEPICSSGCPNGKCIDVEICQCNEGYLAEDVEIEENNDSKTIENTSSSSRTEVVTIRKICKPICPQGCMNGFCTKPNQCECQPGYKHLEKHLIKDNYTNLCIPICQNQCINGNCIGPEECECHNGYRHSNNNLTLCEPICDKNCHKNGYCIAPNQCACKTGYIQVNDKCLSKCELTCKNGVCNDEHDKCICSIGYDHPNINSTLECLPVCNSSCGNGVCIKPNQCLCHTGYEFNEDMKKCIKPCPENAICKVNENGESFISECINGYGFIDTNKTICEPICDKECINGKCIKPNTCVCLSGYDNTNEQLNKCEPICNPLCKNSNCIAPNNCECLNGYHKTNTTLINECEPICPGKDCINGYCIGPNHCKCLKGYKLSELNNMICEPICNPICNITISKCIAPNICDCLDGYELIIPIKAVTHYYTTPDDFMNSQCIPICDKVNCTNGLCISPNKCKCFDGFIFNNNNTMCESITPLEINTKSIGTRTSGNILKIILGICASGFCVVLAILIGFTIKRKLKNRGQMNLNTSSFNLMNPIFDNE